MTTGILNSTVQNQTQDYVAKSFGRTMIRLAPNGQAPLFGLTSYMGDETAVAVEHGFFTKTMKFPFLTNGGSSASASATTLDVVSTLDVLPNMLMRVHSTGEQILISAVISPTQVQVVRGFGTVAAATIPANAAMYQSGTAFEESSVRPNAMQIPPVRITNLTQIFRNTWAISGSAAAVQVIAGETSVQESRMECGMFHAADIEKAFIFGQKNSTTRNGQPIRTMDGFISMVSNLTYYPAGTASANVTILGSTTNYTQLQAALNPVFNQVTDMQNGNSRVLLCGGTARQVINDIGRLNGTYQLVQGQTEFGLQFSEFKIARGSFKLIEHPLFNSNPDWSKLAIAVDLSTLKIAYLGGRKTKKEEFNQNGQVVDNGIDAIGGTLTTECTLMVKNPPANAVLFNFTAAAAG